ncbi:MAG: hypothetical protein MHPSP_000036 [Paramarteilia canceri]
MALNSQNFDLKSQLGTVWLAATNPRRLKTENINCEKLSERCLQIHKFLAPVYIFPDHFGENENALVESDSSENLGSNDSPESKPSNEYRKKRRISLYIATQLLAGLYVLLERKVSLVQKELLQLLKQIKIHLNMCIDTNTFSKPKARARLSSTKKVNRKSLRKSDLNPESLVEVLESRNVYETAEEIIERLISSKCEGIINDSDSNLESINNVNLDEIVDFGNLEERIDTIDDLLKLSDYEIDFNDKNKLENSMKITPIGDEKTPNGINLDLSHGIVNDLQDVSPKRNPDYSLNWNNLKRKKLIYDESQKFTAKNLKKKRSVKIDSVISMSTAFIKSCLADSGDIVNKEKDNNFIIYNKQKIYLTDQESILGKCIFLAIIKFARFRVDTHRFYKTKNN